MNKWPCTLDDIQTVSMKLKVQKATQDGTMHWKHMPNCCCQSITLFAGNKWPEQFVFQTVKIKFIYTMCMEQKIAKIEQARNRRRCWHSDDDYSEIDNNESSAAYRDTILGSSATDIQFSTYTFAPGEDRF